MFTPAWSSKREYLGNETRCFGNTWEFLPSGMFLLKGRSLTFPGNLMATVLVGSGYVYRPSGGGAP